MTEKKATTNSGNPFKEGTLVYAIAKALLEGGTRDEIVAKVSAHKSKRSPKALAPAIRAVAKSLEKKGFAVEIEGRGAEARYSVRAK